VAFRLSGLAIDAIINDLIAGFSYASPGSDYENYLN
jgi:hypothetical protein